MRRPLTSLARGLLICAAAAAFFMAGFWFRGATPSLAANTAPEASKRTIDADGQQPEYAYPLLSQVEALLRDNYLRGLPKQNTMEYGAIRGLLTTLDDKMTFFIDPPVAASESNVLAGQYGGIGVMVKRNEQGQFELYPFRDSPAAKAGVMDGDVLLKVNDQAVPLTTQIDAVDQLLRGEVKQGNGVKIRILNGKNPGTEKEFSIDFAVIEVPSVIWRTLAEEPTFGYIQILRFTARTPEELQNAFKELRTASIKALILDLRNNPGGLLAESIQVASQFLNNGQTVLFEKNRDSEKEYKAENGGVFTDLPIVIITNGGTASAAELVASALKDNKRAITLGQKSYGKFTVQLIFQLADKSSIHVTNAEFFPPSKEPLDGKGVEPTISMIPDATGRDVELGEAIRYLRNKQ